MNDSKYPPITTAALVSYSHLGPFSEVVPAEKMAELERKLEIAKDALDYINATTSCTTRQIELIEECLIDLQ